MRRENVLRGEKAPLLRDLRAAEDRLIAAETEINRMNTAHDQADNTRRKLLKDFDALRKTTTYINTVAHDGLTALSNGVSPGEEQLMTDSLAALQQKFDDPAAGPNAARRWMSRSSSSPGPSASLVATRSRAARWWPGTIK